MKKFIIAIMTMTLVALAFLQTGNTMYNEDTIEKIKIVDTDIPEGYMYGKIPRFAQNVLKNNPWNMDSAAIKFLAGRIYPGSDYTSISKMHMTILATRDHPFNDDIICYIIMFRDKQAARKEIEKINEYVGYNNDRSIVVVRENMAVYFCVDDINNFHHIRNMADLVESRFERL